MKKIFTSILLLISVYIQAQEIKTIELLAPDSKEFSDLNFLNQELQGKDVVMLGEYTHMYGNIFEMKARIIEYLHQELGFNTIAIESPMYDIWKMNQNGFDPDGFNNAIWGVWGNSEEFQRLVNYIQENNLKVVGFDSQIINTSAFIEDFFDFCEENKISLKLDEDDLGIIMESVLEAYTYEAYDIKFEKFEKELQSVIKQIGNLKSSNKNDHWNHFSRNILSAARESHRNSERILTTGFISKDQNSRDREMANNLLYYIAGNKSEKIVVWADNIHVMNNNSSITKPIAKEFVSMGNHLKIELGERVYSLSTLHANDSIYDNGKWEDIPVIKKSFEAQLKQKNIPYLFVSANQAAMSKPYNTRLLSFDEFYEIRLDQVHDGYVFFAHASLPKKMQELLQKEETLPVKDEKEISKIVQQDLITLKGQVVDAGTNEPVSFANIILKEQEIYRVTNEHGFFDLTINNSMFNNATAIISSMGFGDQIIKLNELKEKTYLQPSFESLDEVVITAHLTPLAVLKKAVKNKYQNHTEEPFNYYRYSNSILNRNDVTNLNLDLITKNYDRGFSAGLVTTKRVEQVRWSKNLLDDKVKYTNQIFPLREDPVRYSNILHKRKYKKFKLEFVSSGLEENNGHYIIAFKTDRNRWNYTNRGYPTEYSGKIYIDKETFGIVKVEENWKTQLNAGEIEEYYKRRQEYKGEISLIIKEENIAYYNERHDGKYYPSQYFNRRYRENELKDGKMVNSVFEINSYLYDFEYDQVEEIEYEFFGNEKQTVLNRVEYDPDFWSNLNIKKIMVPGL